MPLNVKEENGFKFVDEGSGEVLLLLHGLFGALSNWATVIDHFSDRYRVVIPMMPIYEMPVRKAGLTELNKFIEDFIEYKGFEEPFNVIGNSLGGHVGLIYTLKHPDMVKRLALTGSSGLFEHTMGGTYPKRGDYKFVKEKVEYTFYDPKTATKDLVDEVFEVTKSIPQCLRMVAIARSAQKHNMADTVSNITAPTLLIWGLNDTITPPIVAHEFDGLIPNTELRFIDECGHAPMMEHPEVFNRYYESFLARTNETSPAA